MGRNGGMHLAQSFRLQTLYLTLLFGSLVGAAFELSYGDDTDLTSFVTVRIAHFCPSNPSLMF